MHKPRGQGLSLLASDVSSGARVSTGLDNREPNPPNGDYHTKRNPPPSDRLKVDQRRTDVGEHMATVVAATAADSINMGREIRSSLVYDDAPYALVHRFDHERGSVFWVYRTEHTDQDALEDVWSILPAGLAYVSQEQCKGVPPEFRDMATTCHITTLETHEKGLLFGINKAQFFATQGIL